MADRSARELDLAAANDRLWRSRGRMLGVFLGVSFFTVVLAVWLGVFEQPPPPLDAYPCGDRVVDLGSDPENCGQCGQACSGDRPNCEQGSCECVEPDRTWCSDSEPCTDIESDARHCGGCDNACAPGILCDGGECRCAAPLTACSQWRNDTTVTSCVDTRTDPEHCGECDFACTTEHPACVAGRCVAS